MRPAAAACFWAVGNGNTHRKPVLSFDSPPAANPAASPSVRSTFKVRMTTEDTRMVALSPQEFEREIDAFDDAAYATPGIDTFCSSSDWILAARTAWAPGDTPWLRRGEHGYAALTHHRGSVRALLGFDTMWGFSCPLVGSAPHELAYEFAADCERNRAEWDVILVAGLETGSVLYKSVSASFAPARRVRIGPLLRRWIASLEGGWDGYLSRRAPKLRENLRRAERRARDESITFEPYRGDDVAAALRRILAVEERSWKGPLETGLLAAEMRAFYSALAHRLAPRGRLRVRFARRDGKDVGYILGAVRARTYRGFQFSFDRRLAHVSLGSLMQADQLRALAEEGVTHYDLGIDMAYKRHWADAPHDTVTLAII